MSIDSCPAGRTFDQRRRTPDLYSRRVTAPAERLLISCGEPSGDLYAAELLKHLRALRATFAVFGLGGDRLASEGAELLAHVRELAVVGLQEVVSQLLKFRRIFRELLAAVDRDPPSGAILVDYPDFNLRLARALARRGIPVVYYVSPQLWAWRRGRVHTVRETVRRMLVIFPFEETIYRDAGVPVTFVGHPLVDLVRPAPDRAAFLSSLQFDPSRPVVALLPGSRPSEIRHNLPALAGSVSQLSRQRPDLQFVAAIAPTLPPRSVSGPLAGLPVRCVAGQANAIVGAADLAIVASGTATVEAALLGTPMVVVYRVAPLTYLLGRPLVHVPHYAMVNLIAGERAVPELIQREFTADRVTLETLGLLGNPEASSRMREALAEVRKRLGQPGASARAALEVAQILR